MKDLNKNAETEKSNEEQNGSNKETVESSLIIEQPLVEKKIVVKAKRKPVPSNFVKSVPEKAVEIMAKNDDEPEAKEKASKKGEKTEAEIEVKKSPKKEKTETKPMVKKEVAVDLKEEKEKPDSVKVIKKKIKKAEEKVDKMKKKVKKAKKKEVKKSKLKGLKEKLENALEKFKDKVEKLKEVKKE